MLIAMAAADPLAPYIEFKDVSKAFGDRVVLQNVSFSVLPGEIGSVLEHARSQAEPLGVTVRGVVQAVGTGLLRLDGSDESLASLIRDLRSTIAPRHGSLVLQHGPEGLRQQVDLWGDVGTALRLMRRMKEQFDPKGILNRGRFVGGI